MASLILFLFVIPYTVRADEYDDLRNKWVTIQTGGTNYNTNDATIASAVGNIVTLGNRYQGYMTANTNPNLLFTNITNLGTNADSAFFVDSYNQLQSMALAYATKGSSLQGNTALLSNIIKGLDWMTNWYNTNTPKVYTGSFPTVWNWYDLEIAAPQALVNTVSIVYTNLSSNQVANYMAGVNWEEAYDPVTPTNTPHFTGANLANKANVITVAGILLKNGTQIGYGRDSYSMIFPYVTNGDGFYLDGSFVFHSSNNASTNGLPFIGGIPYNNNYGKSLLDILPPTLQLLSGSSWAITDPAQTNLYAWVYKAFEPIVYRGGAMSTFTGREIVQSTDAEHQRGNSIMEDILRISSFAPTADAARMQSIVKYTAQVDSYYDFVANCSLPMLPAAEALMANTNITPRGELLGNFPLASEDRMVHLRPGFGFAVGMYSTRMFNYECINNENWHGWHQGDGATYLYNSDLSQYSDGYWWTVNPNRLAGITVDAGQTLTNGQASRILSSESWVGMVSYGGYGAAGQQLNNSNVLGNSLKAKKSWFFFDNEVVCLGAGITSTNNRTIESIVENRLIGTSGSDTFALNGTNSPAALPSSNTVAGVNWAWLSGRANGSDVGYYFPNPATLRVLREARTGAVSDIATNMPTTPTTRNYLSFWFDHGSNPVNATYAYVILPGRSAALAEYYAAYPQVSVLENSTNAQCVQETQLGVTACNFWGQSNYSSGGISVNGKASVLVQKNGSNIDLSISDPTQTNSSLTVSFASTGSNILVSADSGISNAVATATNIGFTVNVKAAAGKTFHALFLASSNTPPSVSITSPSDGYTMNRPGSLTLTASATSPSGSIASVAFYDATAPLGTFSNSPYSCTITNLGGGPHSFTAVATDAGGLVSTSAPVQVGVAGPVAFAGSTSTATNLPVTVDLWTLANESGTPQSQLSFTVGTSSNGTVTLTNGHYAVFTPTNNYTGPASFNYTVTDTTPNTNVLLNYNFRSNSGTTNSSVVKDASGNGYDGVDVIVGSGATITVTNNVPTALSNSLSNSLVFAQNSGGTATPSLANGAARIESSIPTTDLNFLSNNWTVAGWFNSPSGNSLMNSIFQIGQASGKAPSAITLSMSGTTLTLQDYYATSTQDVNVSKSSVTLDAWHHFAVVRSNTVMNLYYDGKLVTGGSTTISGMNFDPSYPVKFAGVSSTNNGTWYRWYTGKLGDLAIFNTALSSNQVSTLTNNTVAAAFPAGITSSNTVSVAVKASAVISLLNTNQVYSGSGLPVSVTVSPTNAAPLSMTYSNPTYALSSIAPTNAGTYAVTATVTNPFYSGSSTATLSITPATPSFLFSDTNQPYNGLPRTVTVVATPPDVASTITYAGSPNPPTAIGSYAVLASNAASSNWNASSGNGVLLINDPTASWRQAYYGTSSNGGNAANGALSASGLNNLQAYTFGIDPTRPSTNPLLVISNGSNNSITLNFLAKAAGSSPGYNGLTRFYNLEATTNLTNASWSTVNGYSNITASNQTVILSTNTSGGLKWFFRLKAWLQ